MKRLKMITACAILAFTSHSASGASVILNEYNAVSNSNQLDGGDGADSFFGTIDGNGGNWFELLVIDDHVDMRGWQFVWTEDEEVAPNETATGTITLSQDATILSDLRSGSILTLIESPNGGGQNNTKTDISYDPLAGDWWINIATQEEQGKGASALATAVTNDGSPGDFSVGKDDWTVTIVDAVGGTVFGPAGEGIDGWAGGGVGNEEGGSLEGPVADDGSKPTLADWQAVTPENDFYDDTGSTSFGAANVDLTGDMTFETIQDLSALRSQVKPPVGAGDYNDDGLLTAADLDLQAAELKKDPADQDLAKFDHNGDGVINVGDAGSDTTKWGDRLIWIRELRQTSVGDVNMDGVFDSGDLVQALQGSKYAVDAGNAQMATWVEGDWNGDMVFDSGDLVFAFQDGGYVAAAVASVPEPTGLFTALAALLSLVVCRRRN